MPTNVLLVIPRNQFSEDELFPVRDGLKNAGCRVLVLSKTGNEATGMGKTKLTPDGMLADWNKQEGIGMKYDAVIVTGGKGAPKSLWKDDILPQILTDHIRAGKVVAGIGLGVGSLAQASVLIGEAAGPDMPELNQLLDDGATMRSDESVVHTENIITASGTEATDAFLQKLLEILKT